MVVTRSPPVSARALSPRSLVRSFARTLTPAFHFTLQEKLLKKLLPNGHKVLIFSQMTAMLDLLDAYFDERKIGCCRIDGSVSWQDRQAAMKRYDDAIVIVVVVVVVVVVLVVHPTAGVVRGGG